MKELPNTIIHLLPTNLIAFVFTSWTLHVAIAWLYGRAMLVQCILPMHKMFCVPQWYGAVKWGRLDLIVRHSEVNNVAEQFIHSIV
jgi:hypothetical protein